MKLQVTFFLSLTNLILISHGIEAAYPKLQSGDNLIDEDTMSTKMPSLSTKMPSLPVSPTLSPQPSSLPTPPPTRLCQDSDSLFIRDGNAKKCIFVAKRPGKMCIHESIRRFCPRACRACEELSCEDADLPFIIGFRRKKEWTCEEVADLAPHVKEAKCQNPKFYTTCRETCKACGADPILIDFDDGESGKQYYRSDIKLENFYALDGKHARPGTGYDYGTISDPLVGYNGYGRPMTMSCPGGVFSLTSVWITPAWANGLSVTLEGFANGSLKHTYTTSLASTKTAEFYSTELSGLSEIDSLVITTSPSQVVFDDMMIEIIAPCSFRMETIVESIDEKAAIDPAAIA